MFITPVINSKAILFEVFVSIVNFGCTLQCLIRVGCKSIHICQLKRHCNAPSDLRSVHRTARLGKLCHTVREMAGSHNSWSGINAGNKSRGSQLQSRPGVVTWGLEVQSQELIFKPAFMLRKCRRDNEILSSVLTSMLNVLFLGSVWVSYNCSCVTCPVKKRNLTLVVFCETTMFREAFWKFLFSIKVYR